MHVHQAFTMHPIAYRMSVLSAAAFLMAASPATGQVAPHTVVVESPVMTGGDRMARDHTPDGRNLSPPLTWSDLPDGTREIAVVCADFGAGNPPPWVHWIIYGVPGTATGLPEGLPILPGEPMPPALQSAIQG